MAEDSDNQLAYEERVWSLVNWCCLCKHGETYVDTSSSTVIGLLIFIGCVKIFYEIFSHKG